MYIKTEAYAASDGELFATAESARSHEIKLASTALRLRMHDLAQVKFPGGLSWSLEELFEVLHANWDELSTLRLILVRAEEQGA